MSLVLRVEKVRTGPVPFQVRAPDGSLVAEINEFLQHLATCGRSGYTLRSYAVGLAHFFGWLAERGVEVNVVRRQVVGEYIGSFSSGPKTEPRIQSGLSSRCVEPDRQATPTGRQPRTVNHRLSLLASYFSYRIQTDRDRGSGAWFQRENPVSPAANDADGRHGQPGRDTPRRKRRTGDFRRPVPRKLPKHLNADSAQQLIEAAVSWRDKAILTLLCRTGQRIGDWGDIAGRHGVLGMMLGDFDRERGMITVLLKGTRGEHRVPVTDDFWPVFDRYLAEERLADATTSAAWLAFRKGRGDPLSYAAFESSLRYAARKIGLKVHAHMFRHTLAQGVLETTGNLKVAQEILGHSHLSTTADLYMHVDYTAMVDAMVAAKIASDRERMSHDEPTPMSSELYAFPYDDITLEELGKATRKPLDGQEGGEGIDVRETGDKR